MSETLEKTVSRLDKAVFGDRDNPNETPGLLADQRSMRAEQARTNEILTELRKDVKKVQWVILLAVLSAVVNVVLKKEPGPASVTSTVQR